MIQKQPTRDDFCIIRIAEFIQRQNWNIYKS